MKTGDLVYVRYLDHVFFKDTDASQQKPRVLEAEGRVDHEDPVFVRLVFEKYADPDLLATRVRSVGLVILKSAILEIRRASV